MTLRALGGKWGWWRLPIADCGLRIGATGVAVAARVYSAVRAVIATAPNPVAACWSISRRVSGAGRKLLHAVRIRRFRCAERPRGVGQYECSAERNLLDKNELLRVHQRMREVGPRPWV